jgi:general secretion pathway protein D
VCRAGKPRAPLPREDRDLAAGAALDLRGRMTRAAFAIVIVSWFATLFASPELAVRPAAAEPELADDEPPLRCKDHPGAVQVTFKADTEVKDLVSWVMGFTCKAFLLDPRVVATGRKVTLLAPLPVTPAVAYKMFLAALSTINLTVVKSGNALRIVDAPNAHKEVLPLLHNGMPDDADQVVRYVYRPAYIAVEPLHQACVTMKSDAGDVTALGPILVITDYASHVRAMLDFARLVDVPGGNDGIYTLPVRHADARKLSEELTAILNPAGPTQPRAAPDPGKPDAARPDAAAAPSKILVDERTNTLIVAASDAAYQRVRALVDRLDVALEIEGGSAIHVYPLGSAIAEELAKTLTQAIGDARSAQRTATATGAPTPAAVTTPGAPTHPPGLAPGTAGPTTPAALDGLGAAIEGQVRIIADPPTNALIVMSSGRDFLAIKDVIRQLDLPRRQVYIDVVILEVEVGSDRTLGTASHAGTANDNGSVLFGGVKTRDVNTVGILQSLQNVTGGFFGIAGKSISLLGQSIPSYAVLFQALAEQTDSNIMSSQSIIAVDNVEAKYKVGSKRPVNMGTVLTPFGGSATASPRIDFPEYPLRLDVKPHISSDDVVLLEVKHEAEELTGEIDGGPTSNTRSFETRVVVHDQETVVLSGLSQDKETSHATQIPLLGDLPLLGYLFKTTKRTKLKTNLVILLTPYIIKDRRDFQAIRERKLREHDEFAQSFSALSHMAFQFNVDYRKKRGLVEEINRAVQDVEADAAARAALGAAAPHGVATGRVDPAPAPPAPPAPPP